MLPGSFSGGLVTVQPYTLVACFLASSFSIDYSLHCNANQNEAIEAKNMVGRERD